MLLSRSIFDIFDRIYSGLRPAWWLLGLSCYEVILFSFRDAILDPGTEAASSVGI